MCLPPDLSSESTIGAVKSMFGRFGIPMECVMDSGPQFASTTISPTYSQSNGQVERTVQTIKNIFKKCKISGDDPTIALLSYCNTPLAGIGMSPAAYSNQRYLKKFTKRLFRDKICKNIIMTNMPQRQHNPHLGQDILSDSDQQMTFGNSE